MFGMFSQVQGWIKIKGATDGTKIGNTGDSLKTLITSSALPAGASTEATLASVLAALGTLNAKDFSTQTTLAAVLSALGTLNAKDFSTQTTLEAARVLLASINGKDFATQTTLNALLTAFNSKDFSTQTTLAALLAKFNAMTTAPGASDSGIVVRPVTLELPTFSVVAENVVVGNNKSMLAIQNTGTSVLTLREIWIMNDQTTAVTGVAGEFRVHRIASFSAGTAVTPTSFDSADSLPAGISAATGATISAEGVLFRNGKWSTDEWGPGTTDVESNDHAIQNTTPFWRQTPNGKGLVLRQNEGAHLRFATNSTAGAFNLRFVFTAG